MLFLKTFIVTILIQSFHNKVILCSISEQPEIKSQEQQTATDFNNTNRKSNLIGSSPSVEDEPKKNSFIFTSNKVFQYCQASKTPKFVSGSESLLTYLLRLQLCKITENRTWFDNECLSRTFAFSEYYKDVYLKFCDPRAFSLLCKSKISSESILLNWIKLLGERGHVIPIKTNNITRFLLKSELNSSFNSHCFAIESFFESMLDLELNTANNLTLELKRPFYDVQYTEWFLRYRPFCHPVGCGISRNNYNKYLISAYNCYPSSCHTWIVLTIIIDCLLAIIIVLANVLVLTVAFRTTIMKNIPGYFKISLAVGDLLVGLVVLPGCVYHHFVLNLGPLPYRSEGQKPQATDYFSQEYLNFMGVFTVWSFGVSIYTMGAASVDRYFAITKPFEYKQGKYLTKSRSIVVFVAVWLFAFVIAIYPVFMAQPYHITGFGLVLSTGIAAIFIYAITLGLPLLAVWVINVAMLGRVCSDRKKRKSLSVSRKRLTQSSLMAKKPTQKRVFSVSPNNDDDVFENGSANKNMRNNNNSKKNFFKGNHVFLRGNLQNNGRPQSRFAKISSTMQNKFKSRFSQSSTKSIASQANVERRLAKTLAVMVGAFTIAILPNVILLAIQPALTIFTTPRSYPKTYSAATMNAYTTLQYFATRLFLSNSFWNCIIYSVRNQHFRRATVDLFVCDKEERRRRQNAVANMSSSSRNHGSQSQTKVTTCDNSTEV